MSAPRRNPLARLARRVSLAVRAGRVAWTAERQGFRANAFNAAQGGRLYGVWGGPLAHPDREVLWNLPTMRGRAREQARNNGTVAGWVETAADNVVGPEGIQLQAKVKNRAGQLAIATNAEIERGWKEWGRAENCSANGRDSWFDLQRMAVKVEETDGEGFIRILEGPEWPFGMALQWLDADMLDELYDVAPDANGVEVRGGVQVDRYGKPQGYWFFKRHPYDRYGSSRERTFVPAADVIHLGTPYRPNQTRFFPRLAPALPALHDLDDALQADLTGYKNEASQGGFLKVTDPDAVQAYAAARMAAQSAGQAPEPITMEVAAGLYPELPPGYDVAKAEPTHPNGNIVEFVKIVYRCIARALGAAPVTLTGDGSDQNYSNMRGLLLPERDRWRTRQKQLIERLHDRVYRRWIGCALLAGQVRLDTRLASNYLEVAWKGRGWPSVDPLKDGQAYEIFISRGWMTNSRVCAELGGDFETNIDELKHEMGYAEAAGVSIGGNAAATERAQRMTDAETAAESGRPRLALAA